MLQGLGTRWGRVRDLRNRGLLKIGAALGTLLGGSFSMLLFLGVVNI